MNDSTVETSKLITALLWTLVSLLGLAAWVTWAAGTEDVWMMLAFTACATSAVAATSQIRCYTLRVCGMLRAKQDLAEHFDSVRSLR